jgi:hypothetical protein
MVARYCVRLPFNPQSHDQLKRFAQARNHTIPKAGLGREGIAQLARQTGDPVYTTLHQIKTLEAISTVMAPLTAAAAILQDGSSDVDRVHTRFMFIDAAGGITSRNPDIITAPPNHKYPGLADLWSKCLVTRPTDTTKLIHLDFGPLELECFALEALDEALLSIVPTAEDWLLETAKFKRTIQGTGAIAAIYKAFMRSSPPQTVYQQNRHLFSGPDMVAYLVAKLDQHFPRSVEYKRMQAQQAHKQGFLRSKFGYERQFYAVMRRTRSGEGVDQGADYCNAVSFMARNHAACVLALFGLTARNATRQIISPTTGPFGSNGFLIECPLNDACHDVSAITPGVLTNPNGTLWTATINVRELA